MIAVSKRKQERGMKRLLGQLAMAAVLSLGVYKVSIAMLAGEEQKMAQQRFSEEENEDQLIEVAEKGDLVAQVKLGKAYDDGYSRHGYSRSGAQKWYRKAAEQGDAFSQTRTGDFYSYDGDYVKAREWYEKAALQGYADANRWLAFLYLDGLGVRQNTSKGIDLLKKSASQKNSEAQYALGFAYRDGMYVRKNKKTAKEWFGKACDNGDQDGCDEYRELNEAGY